MTTTHDTPQPFAAIEGEHGFWTVQALTPNGEKEWVLIECSDNENSARSKANLLNMVVAVQ